MTTIAQQLMELEDQLKFIALEENSVLISSELSIKICIKAVEKLKALVIKHKFNTQNDEIHFFKVVKPKFISKLIYYNKVFSIETKKPYGGEKVSRKYLNNELDKLKRYFDNNLEFYKYHRTSSNYLDHKYFIRGKHDIKLNLDTFYFEADHRFSTSHDYKVAKIIAHDLVQVYLEDELTNLDRKESKKSQDIPKVKLNWTESKTALIELIYALHSQGALDNGKADLKDIAAYFEILFNIDLGDYYRTYLEIRVRKSNRTKFIDSLKEILLKRMDEADEK